MMSACVLMCEAFKSDSKRQHFSLCVQWAVTFAERSAFSNVLTVSHKFRYCGHRFHLNDQACHTVLPLLLTSSHHNALLTPPSAPGSMEEEQPPTFRLPKGLPRYATVDSLKRL